MEVLAAALLLISAVATQVGATLLRGFQCVEHSQPWTAALFDGPKFLCTGTLISDRWVVTAAQCHTGRPLFVSLGQHSLWHFEFTEQLRIAIKAIRHPFFDSGSKENDIMLVKLLIPVFVNKNVRPLALPRRCPAPYSLCVLPGWGTTVLKKVLLPDVLHCGNITTLSDSECLEVYPNGVKKNMLCATVRRGGSDSCQGDPGSPLVCNNQLQGVASWGFDECSQVEIPSVFTKVCNYINWLKQTMNYA
ncbi:PREDICTED: kallikrein-11-like [Gekko japonicus]|uniref:Kallikrein-11-like n=1 Tax=Gekko japonicus TaxID=146911 RepID=A0ABM1KRA3_GEKJA|nr:PREDICTED: kallikrein-11-like [Gekko japonicus]